MTDNEIIKALEEELKTALTINHRFEESNDTENPDDHRFIALLSDTIKLINSQKAEIKRLTSGKCVYLSDDETTEYCVEGPCPNYKTVAQHKSEAIKEFAERLKRGVSITSGIITCNEIDNLVKEMVGENGV